VRNSSTRTVQLLGLLAALWSTSSAAKMPVCVSVQGFGSQSVADYQRTVMNEVRRHPHHTPVVSDCERHLHIEYLKLKPHPVVTGYLDGQVPSRVKVEGKKKLDEAISEVVSLILGSDPAAWIRNPENYLDRVLVSDAGLKKGILLFGLEAFQHAARTGDGASFLPGLGVRIRRGLGPVQVGARAIAAYMPRRPMEGSKAQISLLASLEPEVSWMMSEKKASSFYVAGSLGLTVIRMEGFNEGRESLTDVGISLGVRAGVELLRVSDYRLDLFVQGHIPLFVTNSEESDIVDAYTPGIQIGAGIAF
jgi:hypothetical protein